MRSPTPADKQVDDKVAVLREDDDEQGVEVQALNQQPEEVGHDEVLEKHQTGFTPRLENTKVQTAQQIPTKRGHSCVLALAVSPGVTRTSYTNNSDAVGLSQLHRRDNY